MRAKRFITALAAGSLALTSLTACSGSASGSAASSSVLDIGMPDGPQTDNNNPLLSTSAASSNGLGYGSMIYEPLAMVNPVRPAQTPVPWLAAKWTWSDNYHSVTFTVRSGVTFSDGTPMTAQDVAYSFQLLKQYPALNAHALPIDSATAGGSQVTVTFSSSQYVTQAHVLSTIVVPKHIWSTMKDPTTNTVADPIGTGPYTLKSFTPQTVTLDVRSSYWQALPKAKELRYTSYTGNDSQTTALTSGACEWSYVFIPNGKAVYEAKDPTHYHLWFPSVLSADGLWINTTAKPFDNPALRRAMAMVINRADIFNQGEAGYFKPDVTSVTGLPTPAGDPFITSQYQGRSATVDVAGAKQVLASAGFHLSSGVLKDPAGKPVTITLTDPAGWADYQTDLSIIADNLSQIGIRAAVDKADQNAWTQDIANGHFQAAMHWTNSGATPYDMYENIMDGAALKPIGTASSAGNYGRFNDPAATKALHDYANAPDDATRQAALNVLEQTMAEQVPMIPTSAGNSGGEYSTLHWVGWPSDSNPYAGATPTGPQALEVVLHLKPAS